MTEEEAKAPETPEVRPARDAGDDKRLQRNPSDKDAQLDIELDESFPASDPPSQSRPKTSAEVEESEAEIARRIRRVADGEAETDRAC